MLVINLSVHTDHFHHRHSPQPHLHLILVVVVLLLLANSMCFDYYVLFYHITSTHLDTLLCVINRSHWFHSCKQATFPFPVSFSTTLLPSTRWYCSLIRISISIFQISPLKCFFSVFSGSTPVSVDSCANSGKSSTLLLGRKWGMVFLDEWGKTNVCVSY